jgi:hypothetical protein
MSMSMYRYALAVSEDDHELRRLLAAMPMPGAIAIRMEREPSYLAAAAVEGRFRQTLTVRDGNDGRLVGLGSRSVSERHVNGVPAPIGYLSNLRLLPEHRGGVVLARGYAFLRELHNDQRTQLYLTTIVDDNTAAMQLLTSQRAGMPLYHPVGRYLTAAISLAQPRRTADTVGFQIRAGRTDDLPLLLEFLRNLGPRRQFFPQYEERDFFQSGGLLRDLSAEDLLLAFRDGQIVGTFAAWDQTSFRQNVIHGYAMPLRWLRPMHNLWASVRGGPRLPPPGAHLRCLMGALPLAEKDDHAVFDALLEAQLARSAGKTWDYLLVGMHEKDPLLPVVRRYPARWYTTRLYLVCWDDGHDQLRSLDQRPPYLELGSL